MFKLKRTYLIVAIALVSAVYTGAFADLQSHFFLKSLLILLPVQVGASAYLIYLYWAGRLPGTSRFSQKQAEERKIER
jgi:threonine/homoserine/homoserine lactone efflux protein